MPSDIYKAIETVTSEKNIPMDVVIQTIEAALAAAYRKDFGEPNQNVKVEFDAETGDFRVFDVKIVMEKPEEEEEEGAEGVQEPADSPPKAEQSGGPATVPPEAALGGKEKVKKKGEVAEGEEKAADEKKPAETTEEEEEDETPKFNPRLHVTPEEAQELKKGSKLGDEIVTELEVPASFGRMAAMTAKQVITQKLREAERNKLFEEFKEKEGEIIVGTIQRREGRVILVDLGRITGVVLKDDQIDRENYSPGSRFKFYVVSVNMTAKGPEILLSRSHPEMVRKLFTLEIPEIDAASVKINAVAREAGFRTKVAVSCDDENIDPIGACVGQRGARVQTIINELGGEKIDIIEYDENPTVFITHALAPAKVLSVELNEEEKTAVAIVKEDQLSLAIGKAGQNVRLAAQLTGWKIDIQSEGGEAVAAEGEEKKPESTEVSEEKAEGEPAESAEEAQSDGPATVLQEAALGGEESEEVPLEKPKEETTEESEGPEASEEEKKEEEPVKEEPKEEETITEEGK